MGNLSKFESGRLLPNAEGYRPADILLLSIPLLKQNEWQRFSPIILDFVLVSPYMVVAIGRQSLDPANPAVTYIEIK